jgi:hypothetical protein
MYDSPLPHAPVKLPVGPQAVLLGAADPIAVVMGIAALHCNVRRPGTFPVTAERELGRNLTASKE